MMGVDHKSQFDTPWQYFMHLIGTVPRKLAVFLFVIIILSFIIFSVWSSLPEKTKEFVISYLFNVEKNNSVDTLRQENPVVVTKPEQPRENSNSTRITRKKKREKTPSAVEDKNLKLAIAQPEKQNSPIKKFSELTIILDSKDSDYPILFNGLQAVPKINEGTIQKFDVEHGQIYRVQIGPCDQTYSILQDKLTITPCN